MREATEMIEDSVQGGGLGKAPNMVKLLQSPPPRCSARCPSGVFLFLLQLVLVGRAGFLLSSARSCLCQSTSPNGVYTRSRDRLGSCFGFSAAS